MGVTVSVEDEETDKDAAEFLALDIHHAGRGFNKKTLRNGFRQKEDLLKAEFQQRKTTQTRV
ncbi:hypothetical protein RhiirB3_440752 [Rhizophagus irregularis]|nr:hypothetical protein RhiirB3_440752 [Rhizophagus irregularis]